jgi:N-acetyl-alpha-D-glucosaminyl L-malate synthase BshA
MLPGDKQPRIVATLHGTDTTLLGRDRGYTAAIRHALTSSDAVTTVSDYLMRETRRLFETDRPIDVIPNFYSPRPVRRNRDEVRRELGLKDELLLFHSSNLRSVKRIDLLLEAISRIRSKGDFKLLVLAGESFAEYEGAVARLNLVDRVIVRTKVNEVEDYLQAADLGVYTSEMESFGLSILEGMYFGCPSVAMRVGGIPELVTDQESGRLTPFGDVDALARAVESLIDDPATRLALGAAAQRTAREHFCADLVVSQYEELYRRLTLR